MATNFNLDADALRPVIAQTLLNSLTEEDRQKLLQQAIENMLITPPQGQYGHPQPSALENIFRTSILSVTGEVVREYLVMPDVKETLNAAVKDFVEKKLAEKTWLAQSVGYVVGEEIAKVLRGE